MSDGVKRPYNNGSLWANTVDQRRCQSPYAGKSTLLKVLSCADYSLYTHFWHIINDSQWICALVCARYGHLSFDLLYLQSK